MCVDLSINKNSGSHGLCNRRKGKKPSVCNGPEQRGAGEALSAKRPARDGRRSQPSAQPVQLLVEAGVTLSVETAEGKVAGNLIVTGLKRTLANYKREEALLQWTNFGRQHGHQANDGTKRHTPPEVTHLKAHNIV